MPKNEKLTVESVKKGDLVRVSYNDKFRGSLECCGVVTDKTAERIYFKDECPVPASSVTSIETIDVDGFYRRVR